jgi:hypothetical protein
VVLFHAFGKRTPYSGGSWGPKRIQQSAIYGGIELPRADAVVMRDLVRGLAGGCAPPGTSKFLGHNGEPSYYSGVSLLQSVMHKGHSWHLFLLLRNSCSPRSSTRSNERLRVVRRQTVQARRPEVSILTWLATKSASDDLLKCPTAIFGEFATYE